LMMSTSTEIGGLFAHRRGHEIAQAYGMFCWAGFVLYAATAWRVLAERDGLPARRGAVEVGPKHAGPHFFRGARGRSSSPSPS